MKQTADPAFLDTSYVVRYLTNDPPDLAAKAATVIDSDRSLILSEVMLAESAYVLTAVYQVPRAKTVDALTMLVQRHNIRLLNLPKPLALEALRLCRDSNRVSFADALLWAEATHARQPRLYTFDARFPADGLEILVPDL